jgi:hypothetical protein
MMPAVAAGRVGVAPAGGQRVKWPCASRHRVVAALAGSATVCAINVPIIKVRIASSTAVRAAGQKCLGSESRMPDIV